VVSSIQLTRASNLLRLHNNMRASNLLARAYHLNEHTRVRWESMLTHVAQTLRPHYHGVANQPHSAYLLHTGVSEQTGVHGEKLRGATIPEDPLSFIHSLPLGFNPQTQTDTNIRAKSANKNTHTHRHKHKHRHKHSLEKTTHNIKHTHTRTPKHKRRHRSTDQQTNQRTEQQNNRTTEQHRHIHLHIVNIYIYIYRCIYIYECRTV
jgi:hypothetical protein